ncbi:MAG TPA: hypothetical protein VIV40_27765 [Kofleriaceae bacterium]
MADHPRYRIENNEPIVEVRVANVERLFDNRDPAPFRARDLDPSLVEYLIGAAEDLVGSDRLRVVFWLEKPCEPGEIDAAFHAHFEYELDRLNRDRRRQLRSGWIALAIAIVSIVGLVTLGELVTRAIEGTLGAGLKEGLVISGWVLMWRPVEVLVYESIPWRRQRRVIRKLLDAAIEMRTVRA